MNKERNGEATKEKTLKLRIVLCVKKTQMRNKATKFAIETEEKIVRRVLNIKEFVALINLHYDFS